ncbi:PAS domain S-box protein [Lacinutrix sp. WUR7]|uniref:PAS domain-containing sensor histidine kinase n=1 Tax=Lacinutrix sp. WUR7 TaxID=2653681 RepID=UPI00193E19CA|nr:PAS domain-containing sensor histidine kinase [Lacinutrix sp. WUR7]QRM88828.1 PAS domain S-box protein [Lacinutrix sp. WUR7]
MKDVYNKLLHISNKQTSISNPFLDSIQKSIAIGSWEVNLETMQISWSPMTKFIHEVPQDYAPNVEEALSFYEEGHHRDLIAVLFDKAVNKGEEFDQEFLLRTAKNNLKWVRSIGYPIIENNKTVKILGVFQDVTEKTNTYKELEYKEKLISTTLENAPNGMALVGLKGEILHLNKKFCDYLGYSKVELIHTNVNKLSYPDDINIIPMHTNEMINGIKDSFECEKRYLKKDGSIIYCLLSVSILRDEANKPLHFISNIIDITKSKEVNKKIASLLQTTKSQNTRLQNFAHIVSHNLRSHSGNLEMLLELMKEEIPESTKNEFFPLINEAVNKLSETIQNLNEVANINTKQKQVLESNNLLDFTNNALGTFRAEIIETKAKVNIEINKTIEVLAVPAYLESILLNFVSNAIKYKKEDLDPVININAEKVKNYIKIKIEDNGRGINLDLHKDKIFGLYKTFHNHEDARGLGLYITKNQIDAMNGKVEVTSKVNIGTTFTIYLKYEAN